MRRLLAFLLLFSTLAGCERSPAPPAGPVYSSAHKQEKPAYKIAIHPLHNPQKLSEAYQPLIDHLNANLAPAHFELEASRDYQAYEAKFRTRAPDFLLPNPWQTLEAIKVGYHVMAMAGDPDDFKGLFIVRRDSHIKTPHDLKGKVVSYPSHTALAACIMPQYFLHRQGIDVKRDIHNRYVGSQESSIMNAYMGDSAVGVTWPPPWRLFQKDHPSEAAQLKVLWETPPLLNNAFMARDDVAAELRDQVRALILALDKTKEGQNILASMETQRFNPADDSSYARVREYIAAFEKEVRPVEQR